MKKLILFLLLLCVMPSMAQTKLVGVKHTIDKFSGQIVYSHGGYVGNSGFQIYFIEKGSCVDLYVRFAYLGNGWIFFNKIAVSIDGLNREFEFQSYQKKEEVRSGLSPCLEYVDIFIETPDQLNVLKMMVDSDPDANIMVRLQGNSSQKTYTLNPKWRKNNEKVLSAYLQLLELKGIEK